MACSQKPRLIIINESIMNLTNNISLCCDINIKKQ